MKLILHNMLSSAMIKGVQRGYPLLLRATKVELAQSPAVDFDPAFVARMLPRLDWSGLTTAVRCLDRADLLPEGLPDAVPEDYATNEAFLRRAHAALLQVDVVEGCLVCPETGREFPIAKGIPNMVINDNEAA